MHNASLNAQLLWEIKTKHFDKNCRPNTFSTTTDNHFQCECEDVDCKLQKLRVEPCRSSVQVILKSKFGKTQNYHLFFRILPLLTAWWAAPLQATSAWRNRAAAQLCSITTTTAGPCLKVGTLFECCYQSNVIVVGRKCNKRCKNSLEILMKQEQSRKVNLTKHFKCNHSNS